MKRFVGLVSTAALLGMTVISGTPVASAATHTKGAHSAKAAEETIAVTINPDSKLGPDKVKHDAFSKTNFDLRKGEPVVFIIKNYDSGSHSITAGGLGLNIIIKGESKGVPAITTYKFTPTKSGTFHWQCVVPCDGQAKGWAMSHDGYMAGTITVSK